MALFLPNICVGGCQHNLFLMGLWQLDVYSYISATFSFFLCYVMGSRFRVTLWGLLGRKLRKTTVINGDAVTSGTPVTRSQADHACESKYNQTVLCF